MSSLDCTEQDHAAWRHSLTAVIQGFTRDETTGLVGDGGRDWLMLGDD